MGTDTCYREEVTKQANLCSGIAKSLFLIWVCNILVLALTVGIRFSSQRSGWKM